MDNIISEGVQCLQALVILELLAWMIIEGWNHSIIHTLFKQKHYQFSVHLTLLVLHLASDIQHNF